MSETTCPQCKGARCRHIQEIFGAGWKWYCDDCGCLFAVQAPVYYSSDSQPSTQPTADQKQRYALRQCFTLAIRMARREQKADPNRSSEWNHIIRFCKDADEDGNICGSSLLRQSNGAQGETT